MIRWALGAAVLFSFCASADDVVTGVIPIKPDPQYTTGDYCTKDDPDFESLRYKEKVAVCYRDVSTALKVRIYRQYGIPDRCHQYYTVDHYIPLFMGGSNQPENLWPEHRDVKATRQNLEQELYNKLRDGEINQEYALQVIVHAKQNPPAVVPRGCN